MSTGQPLYATITDALVLDIRSGALAPGASLPSERVLAEQYGVSVITVRRVMTELTQLGLVERRRGAGTFVRREVGRKRIALLVLEFKEAPQPQHRMVASAFGGLVGGVAEAAWSANATLGLSFIRDFEELSSWLDAAARERTCEGVVVRAAADVTSREIDQLEASGLPYVLVKRHAADRSVPCVIADERKAVQLATEHLTALGHQQIGLIVSVQSRVLHAERMQGYEDAIRAAGLEINNKLVHETADFSMEAGEGAARRLLGQPVSQRPTALMVASDSMAMGAYRAAAQWNISIPKDLSIASVDDIPEAATLRPALTTVRMSHADFGKRSVELLLRIIEAHWLGTDAGDETDVIEPTLIVRESSAPPGAWAEPSGAV